MKKMVNDADEIKILGVIYHFFIKEAGKMITRLDLREKVSYNK